MQTGLRRSIDIGISVQNASLRLLLVLGISLASDVPSVAGDHTFDLRNQPTAEQIAALGLKIEGYGGGSLFSEADFPTSKVRWLLPGGIEMVQSGVSGHFTFNSGICTSGTGSGESVMPFAEAVQVVRQAQQAAGIPGASLDEFVSNAKKWGDPFKEGSFNCNKVFPDSGFSFSLSISDSVNPLYDAIIHFSFGWQARRKKAGAPPTPVHDPPIVISLDVPGGKFYDRKDAYRDLAPLKAPASRESPASEAPAPPSRAAAAVVEESRSRWWLWLVLAIILAMTFDIVRRMRRTGS